MKSMKITVEQEDIQINKIFEIPVELKNRKLDYAIDVIKKYYLLAKDLGLAKEEIFSRAGRNPNSIKALQDSAEKRKLIHADLINSL